MRKAIGLMQAIMMILIVSGMMLIVLKYASISSKHTQNSYIREQTELYLTSIVEQTLLKISFHDRNASGCLKSYKPDKNITKRGITYSADVNITKYYMQKDSNDYDKTKCNGVVFEIGDGKDSSHGMILLEVEVKATRDSDNRIISRIIRRTLQQP